MKLWKKVLAAVTAGVLCVGSVGVTDLQGVLESAGTMLTASAEEGTYGNLSYGVTNAGEIEITGCNMGVTSVEIPAEIDRKPVTSIGNNAFRDCTSLTEVKIPDSVINIGDYAFYGCTSLTGITIPDGVTSVGFQTFSGCISLKEIAIPDSVKSIENNAFYGCASLTEVVIPNSVTRIYSGAFYKCTSLIEMTIPDSVT